MVQAIEDFKFKHVVETNVRLGHQILHILIQTIIQLKNQEKDLIQTIAETQMEKLIRSGALPPMML
jgi:hypothetical protein